MGQYGRPNLALAGILVSPSDRIATCLLPGLCNFILKHWSDQGPFILSDERVNQGQTREMF